MFNFNNYKKSLLTIALLGSCSAANADETADYHFYSSDEAAVIDGELNEAVWQKATKIDLPYNINPGDNTPAPVKTEMMLYENGESIFVAFKAYDPDPSKIRAYYRDRDTMFQDDFVGIILDTFNDERRAYEFFVNAYGVQGDLIKDDTQGGREDSNWDAIWDSAGQITEDGYVVEMEIPFKALRFPSDQEAMTWGIDALRIYPRDSRMVLSSNKSDRDIDCHLCQITKINGLKDLKEGNNFQITPTLTASAVENRSFDSDAGRFGDWEDESDVQAGVSVRWGINQNLYLNATLNPDFSQVEADAAQLDVNNTFALFVREKRPFFLDGRDYFNTQRYNLVHTRNINAPDYGVKLTGKNEEHTYGLLAANDETTSFLIPGNSGSSVAELDEESEVLIGRYRYDVGERSNVGVLVTDRRGGDYSNTVTSIDGRQQFNKANSINYQVAFSDTTNTQTIMDDFDLAREQQDYAVSIGYNHRTRDYSLRASYDNVGEDFRADLGFMGRNDFERAVLGGRYTWYGEEGSRWTRWGVFGDWDKTYDQDGNMLEEEWEIHGNLQGPMQFFTNFGVVTRKTLWDDEYYDVTQFMAFAEFDPLPNLRVWTFNRIGDSIDYSNSRAGDGQYSELGGNIKIGKHINSRMNYNYSSLDVDEGELFTANQFDVRVNYQFNLKSFIRLSIQYTDIDRNLSLYNEPDDYNAKSKYFSSELLYAYKINPQSLFYLGYTDNGYQDDSFDDIEKDNRKVFMKLSYAYQM